MLKRITGLRQQVSYSKYFIPIFLDIKYEMSRIYFTMLLILLYRITRRIDLCKKMYNSMQKCK